MTAEAPSPAPVGRRPRRADLGVLRVAQHGLVGERGAVGCVAELRELRVGREGAEVGANHLQEEGSLLVSLLALIPHFILHFATHDAVYREGLPGLSRLDGPHEDQLLEEAVVHRRVHVLCRQRRSPPLPSFTISMEATS